MSSPHSITGTSPRTPIAEEASAHTPQQNFPVAANDTPQRPIRHLAGRRLAFSHASPTPNARRNAIIAQTALPEGQLGSPFAARQLGSPFQPGRVRAFALDSSDEESPAPRKRQHLNNEPSSRSASPMSVDSPSPEPRTSAELSPELLPEDLRTPSPRPLSPATQQALQAAPGRRGPEFLELVPTQSAPFIVRHHDVPDQATEEPRTPSPRPLSPATQQTLQRAPRRAEAQFLQLPPRQNAGLVGRRLDFDPQTPENAAPGILLTPSPVQRRQLPPVTPPQFRQPWPFMNQNHRNLNAFLQELDALPTPDLTPAHEHSPSTGPASPRTPTPGQRRLP